MHSPYFTADIIVLKDPMHLDLSARDSFTILMAVKGAATLGTENLNYGETILIPASMSSVEITGKGKLLEVSYPL